MLPRFQGKLYRPAGGAVTWVTAEGRAAVLEAVEALRAAYADPSQAAQSVGAFGAGIQQRADLEADFESAFPDYQ